MLLQIEQAKDLLSIEYVSVVGLLLCFCAYLIWNAKKNDEKHEKEKEYLRGEIRSAQKKLDDEFSQTNTEMRKVAENYHVFTTQVFDRLNNILNKKN